MVDLEDGETDYASNTALPKAASAFETTISKDALTIPNDAMSQQYGERASTGFIESTVSAVVRKRFGKRQKLRWSEQGAHLMLQTRIQALDGTVSPRFEQWHPGMAPNIEKQIAASCLPMNFDSCSGGGIAEILFGRLFHAPQTSFGRPSR